MAIITVKEFKTHFSVTLERVMAGEKIGIVYGKGNDVVAWLIPEVSAKAAKRQLGILEGKGAVRFAEDFQLTAEDFVGL